MWCVVAQYWLQDFERCLNQPSLPIMSFSWDWAKTFSLQNRKSKCRPLIFIDGKPSHARNVCLTNAVRQIRRNAHREAIELPLHFGDAPLIKMFQGPFYKGEIPRKLIKS